jgi:hypothetical protein
MPKSRLEGLEFVGRDVQFECRLLHKQMRGADRRRPGRDVGAIAGFRDEIDIEPLVEKFGLHENGFGRLAREEAKLSDAVVGPLKSPVFVLDGDAGVDRLQRELDAAREHGDLLIGHDLDLEELLLAELVRAAVVQLHDGRARFRVDPDAADVLRLAAIAYQNKAIVYDLLFKASSQTMRTIAADPKRLGVKIGFTSVLHTWGSAMTHHPHVHMVVPGGGISLDGTRWISCRLNYLLPVKVLSRLFRRLMLEMLLAAHHVGSLQFFGNHAHLAGKAAFNAYLAPLHRTKWFVYSKRPFAGPDQVLAYLSRYTHRVAISNSRLIAADATGITFSYKDYRIEGPGRYKTMTLKPDEFIRRFLIHVLPCGFHRIRHCGLLASGTKTETIARARQLIAAVAPVQTVHQPQPPDSAAATDQATHPCPCCGGRMNIIETFKRGSTPHHRPTGPIIAVRIDTS